MSTLRWFDNLLFLESILGVHRNYYNQTNIAKYFIIVKILFQMTLNTAIIGTKLYTMLKNAKLDQVLIIYSAFSASAYVNLVSFTATGICYSHAFMSYYKSITRVYDRLLNEQKLIKSMKVLYWSTIILTLSFTVFVILRSIDVIRNFKNLNLFIFVMTFAVQTIVRITIIYQYVMFFVVIMIEVNLSKCLNSLVLAVQESVQYCDICLDDRFGVTGHQIQGWVELYQDLANCCEKVTLCFGHQYFFSLASSTPNFILMIYQIFYQINENKGNSEDLKTVAIALFTYGSVMLMPIIAGQLASNHGVKFHRILARLYNTMVIIDSGEAEAKLIKDFIRVIKKNPLEIKLVSKVPAGLYILPVLLMLAVNYLIVMLQFNHII